MVLIEFIRVSHLWILELQLNPTVIIRSQYISISMHFTLLWPNALLLLIITIDAIRIAMKIYRPFARYPAVTSRLVRHRLFSLEGTDNQANSIIYHS